MFNDLHPSGDNGMFWIDVLASDIEYTVNVKEQIWEPDNVTITPNPIRNNHFTYSTIIPDIELISLINLNGQVVYSSVVTTKNEVNLPSLPAGMYIVAFQKGEQVIRKKVLFLPN